MAKKYITQEKLKKNTLADIFIYILKKTSTTRREIEYETGFSWGTVYSNVALLIERGYITEEKSCPSGTVGRTTYLLKPTANVYASIGLDINASGFSCEIVSLDSSKLYHMEADFDAKTQSEVLSRAESLCQDAIEWCQQNGFQVFSLGIAIQGTVDGKTGISSRFPAFPEWQCWNIKELFAKRFDLPVYLGHDPRCMLLGEMSGSKKNNCVLVRVDEGIGMAVSLDGKILNDNDRLELGHMIPDCDEFSSCSEKRCLEDFASLRAIARNAGVDSNRILQSPEQYGTEIIAAGKHLSVALYNMYVLFRPQWIILTGKATQLPSYAESAFQLLDRTVVSLTANPEISAAYGAAVESIKSAVKAFVI